MHYNLMSLIVFYNVFGERYADKYPEKLIGSKESVHLCESPRAMMEFIVFLLKKYKD